jgi:cell division protein FtsI/penicillin-binding protein 2
VLRPQDARSARKAITGIRGAVAIADTMPLAPTREFAAPVLGRVGPATAEIVKASDGRVRVGDVVGLSGLQARYDEQLAGTPGVQVEAVSDKGQQRTLFTADPKNGQPLRTTIDERLQAKAERVLAVPDPAHPGPATALVAIRPSTGDILVAANGAGTGGQNIVTYGQYAPGSTFKIVSSLALLRSGLQPTSPVSCPATVTVNGKRFKNYSDYPADRLGEITLRDAVANSCNTAFIGSRNHIRDGALAQAAEALGFGKDFDLGFPAYFGQVPPAAGDTEAAADLIGQGKILASPMVMAAVTASVEDGRTVVPHLIDGQAPSADPEVPLTAHEAAQLRDLMHAVVTEGSGRLLAGLPGSVGAKTGTAEYGTSGQTHAWMVAFHDDLAVAVFVETGDSGSGTAGPLLLDFLS